jgi:8-oxo-dGTP diphosphatase
MDDMEPQPSIRGSYPVTPRPAVGAVVFKDNAVLLVRRGKPPAKGMWAIPGGSVRLGETLQTAAEREVLEETGIIVQAGRPVYVFDVIEHDEDGGVKFHYVIVDLVAEYVDGEPCPGDDATDARWVREVDLAHLDVNPATRRLLAETFDFGRESDE